MGRRRHHGRERRQHYSPRKPSSLIKIPKFHGDNDLDMYFNWETIVDKIFNVRHVGDQEQVDLVVVESSLSFDKPYSRFRFSKNLIFSLTNVV